MKLLDILGRKGSNRTMHGISVFTIVTWSSQAPPTYDGDVLSVDQNAKLLRPTVIETSYFGVSSIFPSSNHTIYCRYETSGLRGCFQTNATQGACIACVAFGWKLGPSVAYATALDLLADSVELVHGQVTIIFVVSICLFVCLFVCVEFFLAVFDPISIKLGHLLYVWVQLCSLEYRGCATLKNLHFQGFLGSKSYLVLQFSSDCPDFWLYGRMHQY